MKANHFEQKAWSSKSYVCGIDEAGRGSLFGPLVTAAAILPQHTNKDFLKDSKVMTKQDRNKAYKWITQNCFFTAVFVDNKTIDKLNIYNATNKSMKKAFIQLIENIPFDIDKIKYLVVDAMPIKIDDIYKHENLKIHSPTHAESLSCSVAAASIIAKVTRDRLLEKFAQIFSQFDLEKHFGYGTKNHISNIHSHGLSFLHRKTFVSKIKNKAYEQQQTIL